MRVRPSSSISRRAAYAPQRAVSVSPGPSGEIRNRSPIEEGAIKEQFRTLRRREAAAPGADRLHAFARAFEIVETDEPEERVDLLGLMDKR